MLEEGIPGLERGIEAAASSCARIVGRIRLALLL